MLDRRRFIGSISLPTAFAAMGALPKITLGASSHAGAAALRELASHPGTPEEIARDEDYWAHAQRAFTQDRALINLNNGGVSPSPAVVQEAVKRRLDEANSAPPPVALWRTAPPLREAVRARLARQWGVDPEEIAITRNASESLQICLFGHDLQRGDEVLTTTHDYPRMLSTLRQRERREGIVLRQVKLPIPCEDDSAVVRLFEEAITPRTKMILMCHVVNITGQVLPVRGVAEMARGRGIPVVVDGAHALAHLDFSLADLGCDFYGVSLHKWLFAPHGTGLLYVRRERIKGLWPLMAADASKDGDIRKFEEIGTHPAANVLGIAEALTFHQQIGPARKEARLRYLKDVWAARLLGAGAGRVRLHTSRDPAYSCGIATVEVDGLEPVKLADHLWEKHRILTVAIQHEEFRGIRVTPSVYTTLEELDRFCGAVERALRSGIPG